MIYDDACPTSSVHVQNTHVHVHCVFELNLLPLNSFDFTFPAPGDYTSVTQMLTFNSTATRHSVSIPITNDNVAESTEAFISRLTGFTPSDAAVVLSPDVAAIQIFDDDSK